LGQSKTRKLWDLSDRDLELYLHASARPGPRSDREMAKELSEITGTKYHRSQAVNTRDRLRRMGLMRDDFTLTEKGVNDLLDRVTRFVGRTAYEPENRETLDLGDARGYLNVMVHGAQVALKSARPGKQIDEKEIVRTNTQILRKLNSKETIPQLTEHQRKTIAMLLKVSNTLILEGQEE